MNQDGHFVDEQGESGGKKAGKRKKEPAAKASKKATKSNDADDANDDVAAWLNKRMNQDGHFVDEQGELRGGDWFAGELKSLSDKQLADAADHIRNKGTPTQQRWMGAAIAGETRHRDRADKPQKPPRARVSRKAPSNTIFKEIRKGGGIDPGSLSKTYDVKTEFIESGLLGVLKKGGRPFDLWAQSLEIEGHIKVPEGVNPETHLLNLLKSKALSLHDDIESEIEQAYLAHVKELEDAEQTGLDRSTREEIIRQGVQLGEEAGISEADKGEAWEGPSELAHTQGSTDEVEPWDEPEPEHEHADQTPRASLGGEKETAEQAKLFDPFGQSRYSPIRRSPATPAGGGEPHEEPFANYRQRDPEHPVAKQIKGHAAHAKKLQAFLDATKADRDWLRQERQRQVRNYAAYADLQGLRKKHGITGEIHKDNEKAYPTEVAAAHAAWVATFGGIHASVKAKDKAQRLKKRFLAEVAPAVPVQISAAPLPRFNVRVPGLAPNGFSASND